MRDLQPVKCPGCSAVESKSNGGEKRLLEESLLESIITRAMFSRQCCLTRPTIYFILITFISLYVKVQKSQIWIHTLKNDKSLIDVK